MAEIADRVVLVTFADGIDHRIGRADAGEDGIVDGLEAWRIHEAGRTADQPAAWKGERGDRLPAPGRDRASAIADARGAFEQRRDGFVGLEALELVERRERGILVVEIGDQADIEPAVFGVIDEAAAGCGIVEWVTEIMVHPALLVPVGGNFPDFLDPEAIFLRLAGQIMGGHDLLGHRPPRALGNQGILGFECDALGKAGLGIPLAVAAQVASNDPAHRPAYLAQHIDRSRHGKDIDAELGCLFGKPAHQVAQAHDHTVARFQLWRHQEMGQRNIALFSEEVVSVAGDIRPDRGALEPPVGDQRLQPDRVHHRARKDVATDLGGLLHHGDSNVGMALLDADGGGKTGRTRAHDQHVRRKCLARAGLCHIGMPYPSTARLAAPNGL